MRATWIWGWAAPAALAGCDVEAAPYCAPGTWECTLPDGAYTNGLVPIGDDAGGGPAKDATLGDAPASDAQGTDAAATEASASDVSAAVGSDASASDSSLGCNLTAGAGCPVDEGHGIFVKPAAAGGSDATGSGTRAAPVASIGRALDLAKASGKRVYACAGTYAESVVLDTAHDGVGVFGGLDCTSWSYATAFRVVVSPPSPGFALEIRNLTIGTTVADVEFDARDAAPSHAGESSVAAFVHGAQNVSLQRVTLLAGKASDGAPGVSAGSGGPTNWTTAALHGANSTSLAPGAATVCTCALDGTSTGGSGGAGLVAADGGGQLDAGSGAPAYDDAGGGASGVSGSQCKLLGAGASGESAPAAPADAPSLSLGSVSAVGWSPAKGASGGFGRPGEGGGGGGAGPDSSGFGGGGACGGCGGAGGGGGGGGGGSIALAIHDSSVALSSCVLTPYTAGAGGPGGHGEPGQAGGSQSGNGGGRGCQGGAGGAGSGGNGGQGGPGGVSLGIAFSGNAPTIDGQVAMSTARLSGIAVSPSAASGGAKGSGGAASGNAAVGTDGPPGISGVSQAVLAF